MKKKVLWNGASGIKANFHDIKKMNLNISQTSVETLFTYAN
jgi:hypothetical protein